MKKLVYFLIFGLLLAGCTKKKAIQLSAAEDNLPAPYDTTAIDSFSAGAIPADVARNIKMASQQYRDSLAKIKQQALEEQKKQEEIAKMQKIAQDALAKEKTTADKPPESKKENNATPAVTNTPTVSPPSATSTPPPAATQQP